MKSYFWLISAGAVLVVMVIVAVVLNHRNGPIVPPPPPTQTITPPLPPNSVGISIASSITKTEWLEAAKDAFNEASRSDSNFQVNGKPIVVEILLEEDPVSGRLRHWNSGTQVRATVDGRIQPTVLSPASTTWVLNLNQDWRDKTGGQAISTELAPPLLSTPVVIAMWESRARALGCWPEPEPECTWERLHQLSTSPDGWGMVGRPEWGKFRFGYAYVGESDVGTQTAVLFCMTGLQKYQGLTVDEVTSDNACGQTIADVEKAIVHRGTSSPLILAAMRDGGPEFLDAVTTYEKNVIGFNQQNKENLREPLVAVYPQDGTVVADHPFAVMDNAPWVTPEQEEAAKIFRQFLLSTEQQSKLVEWGMRPVASGISLGPPIDISNGANPSPDVVQELAVPDVAVVDVTVAVWRKVKKHANVVLVFDKSGSMQGEKIDQAVKGAVTFVREMDVNDWLFWLPFDSQLYPSTQGLKSEVGESLERDIPSIRADGGTSLYDAIAHAYQTLEKRREEHGDTVRYGIVVLSDGQDRNSETSLARLEAMLRPSEQDPFGIQIHTIGIGNDADDQVLTKIANITHGRYWEVEDPNTIDAVYRLISKYW